MTHTHTPGPWRVGDAGKTIFGPPNGNPSPETVAHVTHKKNVPLLQAAPALLEALKKTREELRTLQHSLETGHDGIDHVAFLARLLRRNGFISDAIAQAEGTSK